MTSSMVRGRVVTHIEMRQVSGQPDAVTTYLVSRCVLGQLRVDPGAGSPQVDTGATVEYR